MTYRTYMIASGSFVVLVLMGSWCNKASAEVPIPEPPPTPVVNTGDTNVQNSGASTSGGSISVGHCATGTRVELPGFGASNVSLSPYCQALYSYNAAVNSCARLMYLPQWDEEGNVDFDENAKPVLMKRLNPVCREMHPLWKDLEWERKFANPNPVWRFFGWLLPDAGRGPLDGT